MEGNEGKNVKLSTVLIILAIIVILVLGFFVYKFYNDRASMAQKASELQSQVNALTNTVSGLESQVKGGFKSSGSVKNNVSEFNGSEATTIQESQQSDSMEDYIGLWYETKAISDTADDPHNNPNSLKIVSASSSEVTFELYITRTATFENVTVSINNNMGEFEATDSNTPSKDNNISKVSGNIEFNSGSVHIKINESNLLYLDSGTEFSFEYKRD